MSRSTWRTVSITAMVFGVPLVFYLATLYPAVGGRANPGAAAHLQFIGRVLGVPEGGPFPLFVLLGHLWTALPFPGSLAVRVNALAATLVASAGAIAYVTARRAAVGPASAVVATWTVLFSAAAWTYATEANTHGLRFLLVALLMLAGTRWHQSRDQRWLAVLVAVFGLGLGNESAFLGLLPGLLYLIVKSPPRIAAAGHTAVLVAAGMLAVNLQLGFVWWRSYVDGTYLGSVPPRSGLASVLGSWLEPAIGGAGVLHAGLTNLTIDLILEAGHQLTPAGVALAAWGFIALRRSDPTLAHFWGITALGQALLASSHDPRGWSPYCLPVWLAVGLFAAKGIEIGLRTRPRLGGLLVAAAILGVASGTIASARLARGTERIHDLDGLTTLLESDGVLVTHPHDDFVWSQVNNYYNLGLGLGVSARRLISERELLANLDMLLSDRQILYRAVPRLIRTDVIPASWRGHARDWIQSLPPGSVVMAIATDVPSSGPGETRETTRRELARAIQPLGIGAGLVADSSSSPWYVAIGVQGRPDLGMEITHPTDAILRLGAGDPRIEGLSLPVPRETSGSALELYAGMAREGIFNRLTLPDRVDLSRQPEIRIFAFRPAAKGEYDSERFSTESAGLLRPVYRVAGTHAPIGSLELVGARSGAPRLRRSGGEFLQPPATFTATVVGCKDRRLKAAVVLDPEDGESPAQLSRMLRDATRGDWLFLSFATSPKVVGVIEAAWGAEARLLPDWTTVRRAAMLTHRVGSRGAPRLHADPRGRREVALRCRT